MPWAFSPKHLFPPKNQNVAKLWKTRPIRQSALRFLFSDGSEMVRFSISGILYLAKEREETLEVSLVTGHTVGLRIRAIGQSWFSADLLGPRQSEVVIMHRALRTLDRIIDGHCELEETRPQTPIHSMLGHLEQQRTRLVLHARDLSITGSISAVGSDVFQVRRDDRTHALIPLCALLWLETCG